MKHISRNLLLVAGLASPLAAIEPPEESEPIPPQAPPAAVPAPADQLRPAAGPAEAEAVPMPGEAEGRPYLGVILDPVPDLLAGHLKLAEGEGVVIGEMVNGGPAEEAGLSIGDVLIEVDGVGVGSAEAVRAQVDRHGIGEEIEVTAIQGGERRKLRVTLGEAPERMPAPDDRLGEVQPLDGFLRNMPDRHAERIREALERNLRAFEDFDPEGGGLADQLQRGLMQRLQQDMGLKGGVQMNLGTESSIRLLDDEGSIEMNSREGHKEARVYDKDGELLWEGPYDTPQDKAAVPDGIRERLERLDFDMDFNGGGMKLRLGPNRFRPFDQLEEEIPGPEPEE